MGGRARLADGALGFAHYLNRTGPPYCPAMSDWTWRGGQWRDAVGNDPERAAREAVRRVVELRDTLAEASKRDAGDAAGTDQPEPTSLDLVRVHYLLGVLNHLTELLGYDTTDLWERT